MGSKPVGLSASRGAAILGVSDYRTPVQAWLEVMEELKPGFCVANGYTLPERKETAPMRWGTAFEDSICRLAGNISDREGYYFAKDEYYITCHIDGKYPDGTLHEGKTTTEMAYRIKWGEEGTDRIPSDYQAQVQHQMICTGAKSCVVSVLVFPFVQDKLEESGVSIDNEKGLLCLNESKFLLINTVTSVLNALGFFHKYEVQADANVQKQMIEAYKNFWNNYIIKELPPPTDNYDDIRSLFPSPVGTLIASDDIAFWAREYKDIGKEIGKSGSLSKRRDELKTLILDWARKQKNYAIDDDSQEKIIILDGEGNKLCQYDGKTFR